jgi:hypothetical protein
MNLVCQDGMWKPERLDIQVVPECERNENFHNEILQNQSCFSGRVIAIYVKLKFLVSLLQRHANPAV